MIRVGVVRGGTSSEYDTSLAGGAFVLRNLPRDKYQPVDIFVDQEGAWHIGGLPMTHEALQHKVDVVWNALHGFYGEDGKVQQLLENLSIPYIGTTPYVAAMTMHKKLLNDSFNDMGLKVQPGVYVQWIGKGPHHVFKVIEVNRETPNWSFRGERILDETSKEVMGFHREAGKRYWRRHG